MNIKILEIIVSVLGTVSILLQNRSETGSSFFASGGDTFKLRKGLDKILFFSTIFFMVLLVILIFIDIRT